MPILPPVKKHHRIRWTVLGVGAAGLIILIVGGWLFYRAIAVVNTQKLDGTNKKLGFFQQLSHLVTAGDRQLQGEAEDRVNILLMGIGGPGHDGPYLTDTMMVASYKPSTKQLAMISIPRDLVVDIPGYDYRKINNVLSIGRDIKYPGGGEAMAVKVVSDLLEMPIQYYARVDFTGFEQVVDRLGGVTVNVENAFTDYQYPTLNYGYQTIRFQVGQQTMNGDIALKYARSRHGNSGEGSDFARARRQQKILFAVKEKALSLGTLINPVKVSDLLGAIGDHSQTNMEVWEMVRLAKLVLDVNSDQVINKVIDDSADGLLQAETGLGGAFILVPRDRNYEDIRFFAQQIFLIGAAEKEGAKVLVVNAGAPVTLAASTAKSLAAFGLTTVSTPLTLTGTTVEQTQVITATAGQFPFTNQLLNLYRYARTTTTLSAWAQQTGDTAIAERLAEPVTTNVNAGLGNPNLVLVLGKDQPASTARIIPVFTKPQTAVVTPTKTKTTTPTTKKPTTTNTNPKI